LDAQATFMAEIHRKRAAQLETDKQDMVVACARKRERTQADVDACASYGIVVPLK
jgi:hypothetical protein